MRSRAGRRCDAGSQQVLTAGPTPAFDQTLAIGVVVIGQFLAPPDPARRPDPDRAAENVDVAVGPARMVDEPGVVAADAGVNHRPIGELEAPYMPVLDVSRFPLQAHLVRDL